MDVQEVERTAVQLREMQGDLFVALVRFSAAIGDEPAKVRLAAEHLAGYRATTFKRLGLLAPVIDEMDIPPDIPLGVVWAAFLVAIDGDHVDLRKFAALLDEAVAAGYSARQAKEAWGLTDDKATGAVAVGPGRRVTVEVDGAPYHALIVDGDMPQDLPSEMRQIKVWPKEG